MVKKSLPNIILEIILIFNSLKCMEMKRQCIKGTTTPGYTIPSDDIVIKYGNPLDITCILNDEYQKSNPSISSEYLYFTRGSETIPKEMITILNSSSIHLHIQQPEVSHWVYNCKLKDIAVCLNTVYVGTKPVLEDDFNCTGINYENLTCFWTVPDNPIPTSYSLRYFTGAGNNRHLTNNCPNLQKLGNIRWSCTWTKTTQPPYRPAQNEIEFELTAFNHLGSTQLNKSVVHFKRVIPAPAENLTYANITSESVVLKWLIPHTMQMFPPGLHHRVMYRSDFNQTWQLATTLYSNKTKRMIYNLTSLPYAYTKYTIGIAMHSAVADPNDDSMWSTYSNVTITTKGKVPDHPPATTVGSFEIVNTGYTLHGLRNVYIYWQQISDMYKNGKNFRYEVEIVSNSTLKPVEITNAYAKFSNLSVNAKYVFNIWSSNIIGRSENFSTVVVYNLTNGFIGPEHFTKFIRDDNLYELSWDPLNYPVSNFTIFACMFGRDRPYQCAGRLYWNVISSTNLGYIVSTPEPKGIYQFAISANSDEFTSGMVWADCIVIANQIGNKLKNVWTHLRGATYIVLNWKLDCSERIGGFEGFSVRYCKNSSFVNDNCEWSELTFNGLNIEQANITDLIPYEGYVFLVAKMTKTGELRQRSNFLFETTHEAAPTAPADFRVSNTTNSSISIFWNEPISINGKLSHFLIFGKSGLFNKVNATERQFTYYNLTSYTEYYFSIVACTVKCSEPSPTIIAKTQGGYPSAIDQPGVAFQNDSIILVEWDRPKRPNGNCDFYEIRFTEKQNNENKTLSIINTTDTRYIIENCGSNGTYNTFFISVRAVNIFNGSRYEGPWSDILQSLCKDAATNLWLWLLGPVSLLVAFFIYAGRRMYHNYQIMRDIEVELPPGLKTFVAAYTNSCHSLTVIKEVPVVADLGVDTTKDITQDTRQCYMTTTIGPKLSDLVGFVLPENKTINQQNEEYIKTTSSNTTTGASKIGYVQVEDICPQNINSTVIVANNVAKNFGYVTVADVASLKKI